MYGREKAWAERDWRRRLGYRLFGELHVPGRLRTWHVIKELRRRGLWDATPRWLLDAGGGEGAFPYFVARKFPAWHVVVADNEPHTIERGDRIKTALGAKNLDVVDVDLRKLDADGRFDVAICADVLEHIEEDDLVVERLGRALKPGGTLIVTSPRVPQPRHLPTVAWRERRIGFSPSDYGHVRQGYSAERLRRLFVDAGLVVDRIAGTFGVCGTLMFDLFFSTGDSRPNPAVFTALFPLYMTLAGLDVVLPTRHGAAILGVARRP